MTKSWSEKMNYTKECDLYYKVVTMSLKKELNKRYDGFYICDLMKKTKLEYKALILRAPDIGGKANQLAHNLYIGAVFIACYRAANKRISVEEMKEIASATLMGSEIIKWFYKKRNPLSGEYRERLLTLEKWTKQHDQQYPTNWVLHTREDLHEQGTCFQFSRCALHELCKIENCCEVMPVLCKIDAITASFNSAKLIRKMTLAEGGSYCDYWFVEK